MSKRVKKPSAEAPAQTPAESPVTSADAAREAAVDAELESVAEAAAEAAEVEDDDASSPASPGGSAAAAQSAAADGEVAGGPSPKKRVRVQLPPPPPERLVGSVEALLLASGDVLTPERLRDLLGLSSAIHVREAIEQVRQRWAAAGLSVELQEVAGGVRVVTRPEFAEYVRRMQRSVNEGKLSQGLLETLSIVAYRQPVARPEIERIRGVQVGEGLRALLERRLLKVVGRSDQPGRPMLYGTTTRFLTAFGLNDLKDLPSAKDLARL